MTTPDLAALVAPVIELARAAGEAALVHYGPRARTRTKTDGTPVTDADEAAEAVIVAGLAKLTPDIAIVSEEQIARGHQPFGVDGAPPHLFWLVDPLDGTREFVARNGEFCVNIGLVAGRYPVFGVLHAPVSRSVWATDGRGGAFRILGDAAPAPIRARRRPAAGAVVVTSRSHGNGPAIEAWLEDFTVAEHRILGSAQKFGVVASGEADLYPRFGPTSEWDTCAGQAVLEAAGGTCLTLAGARLAYGKPGFRNPDFIASGEA
jgi:3'(2'), 5'-bisphosphate nucleotidase